MIYIYTYQPGFKPKAHSLELEHRSGGRLHLEIDSDLTAQDCLAEESRCEVTSAISNNYS